MLHTYIIDGSVEIFYGTTSEFYAFLRSLD